MAKKPKKRDGDVLGMLHEIQALAQAHGRQSDGQRLCWAFAADSAIGELIAMHVKVQKKFVRAERRRVMTWVDLGQRKVVTR
jgi:hypothetical protein